MMTCLFSPSSISYSTVSVLFQVYSISKEQQKISSLALHMIVTSVEFLKVKQSPLSDHVSSISDCRKSFPQEKSRNSIFDCKVKVKPTSLNIKDP